MEKPVLSLALLATLAVFSGSITAQDIFVVKFDANTVGQYNAATGASINSSFISGLANPFGLALSGNRLFVGNYSGNSIGEYDATTGAAINNSFISGLSNPNGIAVSGSDLFVANSGNNTIGKYNATTGVAINSSFITGVVAPGAFRFLGTAFLLEALLEIVSAYTMLRLAPQSIAHSSRV